MREVGERSRKGNPCQVLFSQPLQCVKEKTFYKGLYLNHLQSVFKNTRIPNWNFSPSHKHLHNSWMLVGGWHIDGAGLAGVLNTT